MKYFSTFSGIGGFELGIQAADPTAEFVGYSEIDKYASSVYERNFPGTLNYGDITKINENELPDFDCLVGGFPCQAFSIAGKRRGFDDTRGTLFFDLARILRAKQPRYFVFENVKGLLSHDKGNTFRTIIDTIDELGYDCQWQVCNSKNHGVPQNRERIIIVGHLRGSTRPEIFPIGGTGEPNTAPRREAWEVPRTLRSHTGGVDTNFQLVKIVTGQPKYGNGGVRTVEYTISDQAPTLRATHYKNGDNQPRLLIPYDPTNYTELDIFRLRNGLEPYSQLKTRIRRLTPIECERLQGFPDDWTKYGVENQEDGGLHLKVRIEISDTQRYKMCGNAVTTLVLRDVFSKIFAEPES